MCRKARGSMKVGVRRQQAVRKIVQEGSRQCEGCYKKAAGSEGARKAQQAV